MFELLASDFRLWAQDVFALGLCAAAFLWGGGPERAIAAAWLVVFELGGRLKRFAFGDSIQLNEIDLFFAGQDALVGAIWIAIALNANRNYPLWIAGLQVMVLSAHIARAMTEIISPLAYAVMLATPGWIQLFILAGGLVRHKIRQREHGQYRDWRVPVRYFGLLPAPRKQV